MEKIRCNWCYWIGEEEDLIITNDIEHCPQCGEEGYLMDMEDITDNKI